eukprot:SAG11_NODE_278_length_11284_cov_202.732231_3_plen_103_part_00
MGDGDLNLELRSVGDGDLNSELRSVGDGDLNSELRSVGAQEVFSAAVSRPLHRMAAGRWALTLALRGPAARPSPPLPAGPRLARRWGLEVCVAWVVGGDGGR